jgi:uncharacterized protein YukE
MGPEELRRLARHRDADAVGLAADADRTRAQAAALDGLLDPLVPMSQRVWAGPAANDFENEVLTYARRLNAAVLLLRQIAGDFDRQAEVNRREAVLLRARAVAGEMAAATSAVPGVA